MYVYMYLTLHKEKANEGTLYHKLTVIYCDGHSLTALSTGNNNNINILIPYTEKICIVCTTSREPRRADLKCLPCRYVCSCENNNVHIRPCAVRHMYVCRHK